MKKAILLSLCIIITLSSAGQSATTNDPGYSALETETEACIEKMMADNDAGMQELKTVFENYFSSGQISDRNAPLAKQYQEILDFLGSPAKRFPYFKEIGKVTEIRYKLDLTEGDIRSKKQLSCLTDRYLEYKNELDTNSAFYLFGSILESIREMPDLSLGLIATTIDNFIDKNELEKGLYQKAIVLMFVFDISLFKADVSLIAGSTDNASGTMDLNEEFIEVPISAISQHDDRDKMVLMVVEKMPEYPGGDKEMYKFIASNIEYPAKAKKKGIQGRVYVTFVIERDGTVSDVRILRGIGGGCDEEAIRVVKAMPKWSPGMQKGKLVRVQYNLPISFKLTRK
jgi:TonB family protein